MKAEITAPLLRGLTLTEKPELLSVSARRSVREAGC